MPIETPHLNWHDWMQRWDNQQSRYLPDREQRFTAMLDVLEALLPERFVALDLACGPGSLSQRLLDRFADARAVAVDMDPVMLAVGEGALGTVDGRLRWVDADLAAPGDPVQPGRSRRYSRKDRYRQPRIFDYRRREGRCCTSHFKP